MIPWIALAIACLAFGLAVMAFFGDVWLMAMRAESQRRMLDRAFSDGWKAGVEDGKRKMIR